MKRILLLFAALLLLCACAPETPAIPIPETVEEDLIEIVAETSAAGTPAPKEKSDPDEYTGFFQNDGMDTVTVEKTADGYRMAVTLYRRIGVDEGEVLASDAGLVFRTVDLAGEPMTMTFYRDGDAFALRIDESAWEPTPAGTVYGGFERSEAPDENGERIEPDDDEPPQGHYVFQPKVCSVFMEEVFGKDMCDAWFNLIDAVLKGENTFACKDQYTYDWMMGQFPEHCLPILKELIDYAWDRENAVIDGVAHFTWLVPPEEAKARIEEFGKQIEDILNEVFRDDYSDFEKCLALYMYFSDHYVYDWDTYMKMADEYVDYTSCYRFFQTGIGICHEISSAYSYLLLEAGVQATSMSGEQSYDHAGHQWSYVRINGKEYHIDPTYVLGTGGALRYFLMTDAKRAEEDSYDPATFYAVSHYSQDHPHPDYVADDETFSPLWEYDFEAFDHASHTVYCPLTQSDYGEWSYFKFDYTGY